jgi:ribosomal-protein-alanine N-acetyltransferase
VGLRYARPSDRAGFLALLAASRRFLAPWEPRMTDPSGKQRFEKVLKGRRDPHNQRYLVCRLKDGAILGSFSISNIVRGVGQSATLGVWIGAPFARQGYMREATGLVLAQAFRGLGLHRVEANFLPKNRASRALARGAGFRREGYSPKYVKIAGRWQDHERWALLDEEWRRARRARGR